MLPFLKHNQDAAASGPIDKMERKPDEGAEYDVLESAAEDLIHAVHSKDVKAATAALRAAIDLHFQSNEEGPNG